jgi:hypothetical protein
MVSPLHATERRRYRMRGLALAQMDESVHLRRELDALASLLPDEEQDSVLLEEVSWRRGHQFVGWPALLALTKRRLVLVQKRRLRKGMRIASIPYNEIEIFSTRREARSECYSPASDIGRDLLHGKRPRSQTRDEEVASGSKAGRA